MTSQKLYFDKVPLQTEILHMIDFTPNTRLPVIADCCELQYPLDIAQTTFQ